MVFANLMSSADTCSRSVDMPVASSPSGDAAAVCSFGNIAERKSGEYLAQAFDVLRFDLIG